MKLFIWAFVLLSTGVVFAQNETELSYEELDSLIIIFQSEGDFESATLYAQKGLEKVKKEEETEENTIALSYFGHLGYSYEMLGQYDLAFNSYKKYQTICAKLYGDESLEYGKSLSLLGGYYWNVGNYEKAETIYLEAEKKIRKSTGTNNESYLNIQNNLGLLYHSMGKYEEAELLYLKIIAYDKAKDGPESINYAYSLNNLASLYWVLNQLTKAEPLFLESREIWKINYGIKHPEYAIVTNNLANLYHKKGESSKAEKLYEELLKIDKETLGEKHPSYALSSLNLAACYNMLSKFDQSEKILKEALQIYRGIYDENHVKFISMYNAFGYLFFRKKTFEKSKFYYEKAITVSKNRGTRSSDGWRSLNGLSTLYFYEGKRDTAAVYALASFFYSMEDKNKVAWPVFPSEFRDFELTDALFEFYNNLNPDTWGKLAIGETGSIRMFNGSFDLLLDILEEEYDHLYGMGEKEAANRCLLNSLSLAKIATETNKKNLSRLSEDKDKLGLLRENMELVKMGIKAATQLKEEKYLHEAFAFAEQNKSILLAEAFKGEKARQLGDLPDSITQKEMAFNSEKDLLQKLKYEATSETEMTNIRSQENVLNLEINDLVKFIETNYPKYHAIKYQNLITTASEIQASLDDKSMLLEYFIADSLTYLIGITKEKIEVVPIPVHKTFLGWKIKGLRLALTNYKMLSKDEEKAYEKYTQSAHWFYQNMLEPILKNDQIEHLIIVADGELGHIPFETFLVEYSQDLQSYQDLHYLVNDYNISYNYSATLWNENLKSPKKQNNNQLLACAATYEPIDSSLMDLRNVYEYNTRRHLPPLPAVLTEVESLKKSFEGTFLRGDNTNEAYFKAHAGEYAVIHLAMHGILHPRVPILSSLAFTENKDSIENNLLQAYEISQLKLNADLVVLSACETGFGEFEQGEGVMSLARSFMYAGTPSLVVSLWQVNDQCTSLIMSAFYRYLSEGMPIDGALRQAKLDFIQHGDGRVAHPAFWSPFIQLGDARPISIASKGSWNRWYVGGGLILLALIGGLFLRKES